LNQLLLTALILVEAAFLAFTFITNLRSLLGEEPHSLFVLISANIAFLVFWIGAKLSLTDTSASRQFDNLMSGLRDVRISQPGVTPLVDHDFYERFGKAMQEARTGVSATHLDSQPPNRNKKTPAAEYYDTLIKTIKHNAKVSFRRVERASLEKRVWLEQLVRDYDGVGNFSLGVLLLSSRERRTGLVSVQLVDENDVVLVAVAEHDSSLGVRDIWITNRAAADLWRHYYEDILWRPAARVIENGRLNQNEWKRVTDFIENQ
jgi:hypothetical protein